MPRPSHIPQAAAARTWIGCAKEMDMERMAIVEVDVRVAATGMRASRLIGADVYNDGDEHIGTLDDLMIGDDGTVGFAILSWADSWVSGHAWWLSPSTAWQSTTIALSCQVPIARN
jgi:hypothetical protein